MHSIHAVYLPPLYITTSLQDNLKHHHLLIKNLRCSEVMISLHSCINMHAQYEWDIYIMARDHVQPVIISQKAFAW